MNKEQIYWLLFFAAFFAGISLGWRLANYEQELEQDKFMKEVDRILDAEAEGKWKGDVIFIPIEK